MSEWVGFGLVAGVVTVVCLIGLVASARRRQAEDDRLIDADERDSPRELVLGDMTEALAKQLPGNARDQGQILPLLLQAGYYRPSALTEYLAIRTMLVLVPLALAGALALFVEPRRIPVVAICGLVAAMLGYALPRAYIASKARRRVREIERGLPVFADLMTLSLLAGQNILSALRRVTKELRNSFPALADELTLVIKQAELDSLEGIAQDRKITRLNSSHLGISYAVFCLKKKKKKKKKKAIKNKMKKT